MLVNFAAALGCETAAKKDVRILCYERLLNTEHSLIMVIKKWKDNKYLLISYDLHKYVSHV